MNIDDKLRQILKNIDDSIDVDSLTRQSSLKDDIGLSSVALLYMAVAIEDEFGIDLSGSDLSKLKTVNDVIAEIEKLNS